MNQFMQYKGYCGSFELSEEDLVFYGKVEFIKALLSYESTTAKGLVKAFHAAVDDYLKLCELEGKESEIPFKGTFNVRVGPDLHRQLALLAAKRDVSLNRLFCEVLSQFVKKNT